MTIIQYPADRLRDHSIPVEHFDSSLSDIAEVMFDECQAANGLAVAANQVGLSYRMFVCPGGPDGGIYINPCIVAKSDDEWTFKESCLSVDGAWYITRPNRVTMRYWTVDGKQSAWTDDHLLGRVIQHEIDHLDGKLLIDLITKRERKLFDREFVT